MADLKIGSASASDLTNAMTDYSVDTESTDGTQDQEETRWMNDNWTQELGYYKNIPEIKAVIDAKATWTVGKGIKTDPDTQFILDKITGWGKDTFNTIIENAIRTMQIGGDSYAEIVRDPETKDLINLKPLDPETMVHITNSKGMLVRFEQASKLQGHKPKKLKPEQIFHLPRNRVADETHGQSLIDPLAEIILMKNEAMSDFKRVLHRNIDPLWIFHMDTDDTAEIAAFKAKQDAARGAGENMFVPKDVIVPELMAVAPNATFNPLAWIEMLDTKFYEAASVPKIILGGSGGFTEAAVKIAYLAFQQTVEEDQLFIEEQVGIQLGLEIELEFPASLENELLSDNKKDGAQNIDASETTAGEGQ